MQTRCASWKHDACFCQQKSSAGPLDVMNTLFCFSVWPISSRHACSSFLCFIAAMSWTECFHHAQWPRVHRSVACNEDHYRLKFNSEEKRCFILSNEAEQKLSCSFRPDQGCFRIRRLQNIWFIFNDRSEFFSGLILTWFIEQVQRNCKAFFTMHTISERLFRKSWC